MEKTQYTAPKITVYPMQGEATLDTLSLPIGQGDAQGSGDAKGGFFDETEDEEIETPRPWGDISY